MAKRTKGLDEAILARAKEEFLARGYESASLRTIAQNAAVSTSAIYTRFGDKEGLFRALVEPAAEQLLDYMRRYFGEFTALEAGVQASEQADYAEKGYDGFLDILYEHFEEFQLLVNSATNGIYRGYLEKIVALDTACTVDFLRSTGNRAYQEGRITEGFIHIVSAGFYAGLFEIAVHNIERDEAEQYLQELKRFYAKGWSSYL